VRSLIFGVFFMGIYAVAKPLAYTQTMTHKKRLPSCLGSLFLFAIRLEA
jgi:hypothetical protein